MNELTIVAAVVSVCASALSILFYINMARMLRKHAVATRADTELLVEHWMRIMGTNRLPEKDEQSLIN